MFLDLSALFIIFIAFMLLFAMAAVFGLLIFGPYALAWMLGRKLRKATQQTDSEGHAVQLTLPARLGIGADTGLIAGIGRNAEPERTLNEITLRPTLGLRFLSLGGTALAAMFIYIDENLLTQGGTPMILGLSAMLAYALIRTNFYTLRYDRDGFITTDALFRRREVRWRDVVTMQDNGHYLYVFRMADGGKLEIHKYLVGIRDFLTYAKQQMAYHDRH